MYGNEPIFLDYQSTTPVDPRVVDAMRAYFDQEYGNPHSSEHILGWRAMAAVERAKQKISSFVGAEPNEVIFTSGATESNNLAILGSGRGNKDRRRSRILVTTTEHKCVLAAANALKNMHNYQVDYIPVNPDGVVDLDFLEDCVADDVLLISVMAVNNEIGTIQPLTAVREIARRHQVLVHTDAAQAPCAMDLGNIMEAADLVSLSAHKFYGPKGIGALVISRELKERLEPIIYGGGQQDNLRSGTLPVPLIVGMAAATGLLSSQERTRLGELRHMFLSLVAGSLDVKVNGPGIDYRHPGNLNLQITGIDASDLLQRLQPKTCFSTGSACSAGSIEPSHVLRAIGLDADELDASFRISLGRFTDQQDVVRASELIINATEQAKSEFTVGRRAL